MQPQHCKVGTKVRTTVEPSELHWSSRITGDQYLAIPEQVSKGTVGTIVLDWGDGDLTVKFVNGYQPVINSRCLELVKENV